MESAGSAIADGVAVGEKSRTVASVSDPDARGASRHLGQRPRGASLGSSDPQTTQGIVARIFRGVASTPARTLRPENRFISRKGGASFQLRVKPKSRRPVKFFLRASSGWVAMKRARRSQSERGFVCRNNDPATRMPGSWESIGHGGMSPIFA